MDENNVNTGGEPGGEPKNSGKAIGGFVTALVGFLCCLPAAIVGLILSIVAVYEINKDPQAFKGKGLAIAGIVLGSLAILFQTVFYVLWFGFGLASQMGSLS